MKVCFVTYDAPGDIGGLNSWLQKLLPQLQMAGIEIEVHVMGLGLKPADNCAFFTEHGMTVRWMPFLRHVPYAVRSLLQFLKESEPDVYVPTVMVPAYYAAGYARRAGIPTVGTLLADNLYHRTLADEFISKDSNFRVSAFVACSAFLESQVSATAAARGVTVRRIACGVPIPPKTAEPPGSVFRLVYTGRLVEEAKRISDVTRALCAVTQNTPNLEAWITGRGDARPAVEDIIRESGNARVRLLGRVDEVYEVLAQCHALVLLSDYEGLPISVLEAMATGVVPICLDMRSGIREAIEHDVNGLIVKDRAADFFGAVQNLQSDPEKWRRLSAAAQETIERRFSTEICARQWIDLLEELSRQKTALAEFPAFGELPMPSPNPKFEVFGVELSRGKILKEYMRSIPPVYRIAMATMATARKWKSGQADQLI
jgi:colanic acid/amylovoran biosynthesis glycosyltransferase